MQTKIVFFFSPNSFKKGKLLRDRIFFLMVAEFFFWTGRKVLQRVGLAALALSGGGGEGQGPAT
jgi:hypothetical protein